MRNQYLAVFKDSNQEVSCLESTLFLKFFFKLQAYPNSQKTCHLKFKRERRVPSSELSSSSPLNHLNSALRREALPPLSFQFHSPSHTFSASIPYTSSSPISPLLPTSLTHHPSIRYLSMGNEQSTETLPTDQPSTQSPSPSIPPSPSHPSSFPMSPQPPTSPSNPKSSQRRSTRQKRWRFCPCDSSHATKQACEGDPTSPRYTGDYFSTFVENPDGGSDDDESGLNFKSGDESPSPSDSNSKGKEEKMPSKRAATGGKSGRPKRSKVEEKGEQGCDCAENHGSLAECERENLRREGGVRVE